MGVTISSPLAGAELSVSNFCDPASPAPDTNTLFSSLYAQLHSLARRELARRLAPGNLSVTTLLHEAYIDMSRRPGALFPDEARFIGYAARVMRGIIIDHARNRTAIKRGGEFHITALPTDLGKESVDAKELAEIGDALDELAEAEPELAEVIELKFFCGCSFAEIAALQKLSERTVQRRWEKARLYLRHKLAGDVMDEKKSCRR